MMSTIITGGSSRTREEAAFKICNSQAIHAFDRHIFSPTQQEEKGQNEERIGIGLIRKIQQKMLLKPLQSQMSALIIQDAQALTVPAQQALLKILEEPPAHTIIILTVENESSLLPTICSRCKVTSLQNDHEETQGDFLETLLASSNISLGERLVLAEMLTKDTENHKTVKQYVQELRKQLCDAATSHENQTHIQTLLQQTKCAQELYTRLTNTNTNQRLLFEHFLLQSQ